jgi:hypothetical protein
MSQVTKQLEHYSSGDVLNLDNRYPTGVQTVSNSGTMTITVNVPGTTDYKNLRTIAGTSNFSITTTANTYVPLDPTLFKGLVKIKVVFASPSGPFYLGTLSN